jgi:hypothetical protein
MVWGNGDMILTLCSRLVLLGVRQVGHHDCILGVSPPCAADEGGQSNLECPLIFHGPYIRCPNPRAVGRCRPPCLRNQFALRFRPLEPAAPSQPIGHSPQGFLRPWAIRERRSRTLAHDARRLWGDVVLAMAPKLRSAPSATQRDLCETNVARWTTRDARVSARWLASVRLVSILTRNWGNARRLARSDWGALMSLLMTPGSDNGRGGVDPLAAIAHDLRQPIATLGRSSGR